MLCSPHLPPTQGRAAAASMAQSQAPALVSACLPNSTYPNWERGLRKAANVMAASIGYAAQPMLLASAFRAFITCSLSAAA